MSLNFQNKYFKLGYRTEEDDIVEDFYKKAISTSNIYKRAVGYFSTGSLLLLGPVLDDFIKRDAKMYLIASPDLQEDDVDLIRKGYELRDKIIETRVLKSIELPEDEFSKITLSKVERLIANGNLDIKIAFRDTRGIFHEKIGILIDGEGNKIAFNGSLNETGNAYNHNFESIDLYFSWDNRDSIRINTKEGDFDKLWENKTNNLRVIDFTKAIHKKLLKFREDDLLPYIQEEPETYEVKPEEPTIPLWVEKGIRPYQELAYKSWVENDYQGIFEMATGTGKTITACYSLVKHYRKCISENKKQIVIVVVPYKHLVDQWYNEMHQFGYSPYKVYSDILNWKENIQMQVMRLNFDKNRKYLSIITTVNSFKSQKFKEIINSIVSKYEVVIVGDEAHNLGAENILKELPYQIKYRLGLTATPIRHNDEQGTQKLLDYFNDIIFKYSLKDAIENGYLTKYYYYPVIVYLDSEESAQFYEVLSEFKGYSVKKLKYLAFSSNDFKEVIRLTYQIADGSINKFKAFKELMMKYKDTNYNLVYCNSVAINDGMKKLPIKQIEGVNTFLGHELGMRVHTFTAQEDNITRQELLKRFATGNDIQALVAMKCLDEGVDVPATQRAFILSSTTNEKQFIQRRGRVLRNSPGKEFAEIYDFITLPRQLKDVGLEGVESNAELYVVHKEYKRIVEFATLAVNAEDGMTLATKLDNVYNFSLLDKE